MSIEQRRPRWVENVRKITPPPVIRVTISGGGTGHCAHSDLDQRSILGVLIEVRRTQPYT
jgi:hypothetical protein